MTGNNISFLRPLVSVITLQKEKIMGGSSFDLLIEQVAKQQEVMEALEVENRELRHQLADLREGRNIFVEIYGQRFALNIEREAVPDPSEITDAPTTYNTSSLAEAEKAPEIIEAPTVAMSELSAATKQQTQPAPKASPAQEKSQTDAPTFLEEMMIQEFASAMTSPMAVWTGPVKKPEPAIGEEDKKAALRRELMGSFLLE
jgi:hypothetical protein